MADGRIAGLRAVLARRAPPRARDSGDSRALLWTGGAFAAAVLLHVDRLPPWCSLAVLALTAWRATLALRHRPLPGNLLRVLVGALLLLAVAAQFSTISGLAAGSSLLAGMGALKLLETRARRDYYVVIGVALFLVLAACLDRQSLLRVPLYVGAVWLVCAALAIVGTPQAQLGARAAVSMAGRSLAYALPIAIGLFLFFPRVQGQVWALPGAGAGVTGLSNEMSPGAISELSSSYEPAFRVRFSDRIPAPRDMYWRGPVLQNFDGYTWRREPRSFYRQSPLQYLGDPIRYRVTLEPNQRNWWFALDTPTGSPERGVVFTHDYQLVALRPVTQPVSYELTSHTATRAVEPLSPLQRRLALQLPAGRNGRSVALARQLRSQAADETAFVRAVLELFRGGGYVYTLTPPRLDLESIDDFLFNTRQGFCGHYASAFATLARAAGLPARVVTGYQGGEWNPIGAYYIVRQSDAHAWAEVWLDGRGWTRVDPTSVVAPDRLNRGFFESMPGGVSQTDRLLREIGWLADARLAWDTVNTWWKGEVIEFNLRSQLGLLSRLGFDSPRIAQLGALLAAALLAWLAWIGLRFGRMPPPRDRDALGRAYRRLGQRLAAVGLPRDASEGPLAYAERIAGLRPALAAELRPVLESYARLRYGPDPDPAELQAFPRRARRLRLRRSD
jgi:transglutaminase-like putative cysteine protease